MSSQISWFGIYVMPIKKKKTLCTKKSFSDDSGEYYSLTEKEKVEIAKKAQEKKARKKRRELYLTFKQSLGDLQKHGAPASTALSLRVGKRRATYLIEGIPNEELCHPLIDN